MITINLTKSMRLRRDDVDKIKNLYTKAEFV